MHCYEPWLLSHSASTYVASFSPQLSRCVAYLLAASCPWRDAPSQTRQTALHSLQVYVAYLGGSHDQLAVPASVAHASSAWPYQHVGRSASANATIARFVTADSSSAWYPSCAWPPQHVGYIGLSPHEILGDRLPPLYILQLHLNDTLSKTCSAMPTAERVASVVCLAQAYHVYYNAGELRPGHDPWTRYHSSCLCATLAFATSCHRSCHLKDRAEHLHVDRFIFNVLSKPHIRRRLTPVLCPHEQQWCVHTAPSVSFTCHSCKLAVPWSVHQLCLADTCYSELAAPHSYPWCCASYAARAFKMQYRHTLFPAQPLIDRCTRYVSCHSCHIPWHLSNDSAPVACTHILARWPGVHSSAASVHCFLQCRLLSLLHT